MLSYLETKNDNKIYAYLVVGLAVILGLLAGLDLGVVLLMLEGLNLLPTNPKLNLLVVWGLGLGVVVVVVVVVILFTGSWKISLLMTLPLSILSKTSLLMRSDPSLQLK